MIVINRIIRYYIMKGNKLHKLILKGWTVYGKPSARISNKK